MNKKDLGLLVLILVVGLFVYLRNPLFLSPNNLANTANLIGLFGLFSIAQGFVIITGGIELSVGSMIALLGVLFVDMVGRLGVPWPIAAGIVMLLGFAMGLAHGLLITKLRMQPFVVTLCGLLIYRGVSRGYTADATAGFPFGSTYPGLDFFVARPFGIPTSVYVLFVVAIVAWIVLHRSVFGRYLYAVGKNEEAARFSGIRTDLVVIAAYVICAALTAIAAIFFAMYTRSVQPSGHANFYELYAIAAAVLGGFSLRGGEGSVIGVLSGHGAPANSPKPRQPIGNSIIAELRGDGYRDPRWCARRSTMGRVSPATTHPRRGPRGVCRGGRRTRSISAALETGR